MSRWHEWNGCVPARRRLRNGPLHRREQRLVMGSNIEIDVGSAIKALVTHGAGRESLAAD